MNKVFYLIMLFFFGTAFSFAKKNFSIKGKISDFKVEDVINNLKIYEKRFSESELWNKIAKIGK
mgnify:CR=1 FL=1